MSWDNVKNQVSGVFQDAVVSWVKSSVPKPPGANTQPVTVQNQPQVVEVAGIDNKYILLGAAAVGLVALFLIMKKGK